MIKKIKTDNINIDILFNEIEHYKTAFHRIEREHFELKVEHEAFKSAYKRRIERLMEENRKLKKEIENLKNNS